MTTEGPMRTDLVVETNRYGDAVLPLPGADYGAVSVIAGVPDVPNHPPSFDGLFAFPWKSGEGWAVRIYDRTGSSVPNYAVQLSVFTEP